jgi:hypothetical protein
VWSSATILFNPYLTPHPNFPVINLIITPGDIDILIRALWILLANP